MKSSEAQRVKETPQRRQLLNREVQLLIWSGTRGEMRWSRYISSKKCKRHPLKIPLQLLYSSLNSRVLSSSKREFSGSSATSYKTSYLNHASTYLTVVSYVPRWTWTWKAIFVSQQKQLSFHVLACHLTSECRHSALQGCQRATSYLLKKV